MPNLEYYTSETVIWDNVKKLAEAGVQSIYREWSKGREPKPFAITWPGVKLLSVDGLPVDGPCNIDLPTDPSTWSETLRQLVHLTEAYALLLAEPKEKEVKIILESHHGTRSWTIPISQSGDVRALGDPKIQDNVDRIGILWEPRRSIG